MGAEQPSVNSWEQALLAVLWIVGASRGRSRSPSRWNGTRSSAAKHRPTHGDPRREMYVSSIGACVSTATAGILVVLGAGCADSAGSPAWTVWDSAGVEIISNSAPSSYWRLGEEPVISLGVVDQGGPTEFFRVEDIAILDDGGVAVANRGSEQVRLFDAEGRHLLSFGRKGSGPREFRLLSLVEAYGDSLLVYDEGNDRITVWSRGGRFGRSFRLDWFSGLLGPEHLMGAQGILTATARYMSELPGEGLVVDTALVSHYDLEGHLIDSIGRFPHNERVVRRTGDRQMTLPAPFSERGQLVGTPIGFCYAFGPSALVHCYGWNGQLERAIRLPLAPRQVTAGAVEAFWQEQMGQTDGPRRDAFQRLREFMPFPKHYPALGQLLMDGDGRIWARAFSLPDEHEQRWFVLEDGRLVAELATLRGLRVMDVRDGRIAGVRTDDFGVEFVEVWEFGPT